jgi:hypothetical protein
VLPPDIGKLVTLVELRVPENALRVLPEELAHCFNLRKLSVQSNLLTTLPPVVCAGLSKLHNLNISHNQVLFLPDTIGEMCDMIKFRADQNQIRVLPDTIGQCTSLQLLSLTCNQLAYIPDSVSNCTVLTALHVSSNRFRQLPRCIDDLVGLRRLWAANNELIGLPTSLARLEHLFELQVPAAPAPPRAFSHAPLGEPWPSSTVDYRGIEEALIQLVGSPPSGQVKGSPDLRYPPEEVVTEGRDAVVAYLLANMRCAHGSLSIHFLAPCFTYVEALRAHVEALTPWGAAGTRTRSRSETAQRQRRRYPRRRPPYAASRSPAARTLHPAGAAVPRPRRATARLTRPGRRRRLSARQKTMPRRQSSRRVWWARSPRSRRRRPRPGW